jgi:hypothetical protein
MSIPGKVGSHLLGVMKDSKKSLENVFLLPQIKKPWQICMLYYDLDISPKYTHYTLREKGFKRLS